MKSGLMSNVPEDVEPPDDDDDYEITFIFQAQWRGRCTINFEHEWRRGQRIGRVVHASNPMLPVQGYACAECTKLLPRSEHAHR